MDIVQKYKNYDWWDFKEFMSSKLEEGASGELYIEFLDELRLRLLNSLSEGATYKIKNEAQSLYKHLKENRDRIAQDNFNEFVEIYESTFN